MGQQKKIEVDFLGWDTCIAREKDHTHLFQLLEIIQIGRASCRERGLGFLIRCSQENRIREKTFGATKEDRSGLFGVGYVYC